MQKIIGNVYFLKAMYLLHPFVNGKPNKNEILGYSIACMSSVQQGQIIVQVENSKVLPAIIDNLNSANYFMQQVSLVNPFIKLGQNGKYKIVCSDIKIERGS